MERFKRALRDLRDCPELGSALSGRWGGYRFLLGPWCWMVIVYRYDAAADLVAIVTVQDGRGRRSSTHPS